MTVNKVQAKAEYEVDECAVCDLWDNITGCSKDKSEECGECPFQPEGDKDGQ